MCACLCVSTYDRYGEDHDHHDGDDDDDDDDDDEPILKIRLLY